MSDHIPYDELLALTLGTLPYGRLKALLPHLLQCATCLPRLASASAHFSPKQLDGESMAEYDGAIERAFQRTRQVMRKVMVERARTQSLLRRLEEGGLGALPVIRRGWEIPAVEAVLQQSWALRYSDPGQMAELAEFAELLTRRLRSEDHGATRIADLRFRACADLANVYRIKDRLTDSEQAFGSALEYYSDGTRDQLLLARFLSFRSSLHRARRQLTSAQQYLLLAYTIYRRHGQRDLAGRTLISMGIAIGYGGQPERAIRCLQRGLSMIDQTKNPELVGAAIHNQLWFLVDAGRIEEARRNLFLNRHHFVGAAQLCALKLQWLEARIDAGAEKLDRAEENLRDVQESFEEMGLAYDNALAGLDLAAVTLRNGHVHEARNLLIGAVKALGSLGIRDAHDLQTRFPTASP
jgi:tetratricopeptide (TPR) repeat protein